MKNALNKQVGMLGDMFLWLVANLKQGVIYCIKQALPPNISAGSVSRIIQVFFLLNCKRANVIIFLKPKHPSGNCYVNCFLTDRTALSTNLITMAHRGTYDIMNLVVVLLLDKYNANYLR